MKKYLSVFLLLSILFAGCVAQDDKAQNDKTETTTKDKKEEKSKAEKAKEKIAENKKSKKYAGEKTTEKVEKPVTQEPATDEPETAETQIVQSATVQEPATQEQVQNNQPTEQERINFCKNIRGGIPEACQTPAIIEAGNKKGVIERQAFADYNAGLITQEQYDQKLREATEIMNQAWLQEYGVNPGQ